MEFSRSPYGALKIQAYAHEMLGKIAIEHTKTKEAIAHFQEMYDIAEEVNDADLLAQALIHQAEMLRRDHLATSCPARGPDIFPWCSSQLAQEVNGLKGF